MKRNQGRVHSRAARPALGLLSLAAVLLLPHHSPPRRATATTFSTLVSLNSATDPHRRDGEALVWAQAVGPHRPIVAVGSTKIV